MDDAGTHRGLYAVSDLAWHLYLLNRDFPAASRDAGIEGDIKLQRAARRAVAPAWAASTVDATYLPLRGLSAVLP